MRRLRATAAALLGALCAVPAVAEQVGRTSFSLPAPAWELVATHDHELLFNGGQQVIPLRTAAFALPGANGVVHALLVITSSEGGHNRQVQWITDKCAEPRPKFFTNDYGTNSFTRTRECLVVNRSFNPATYFAKDDWLREGLAHHGWRMFKGGYSLRTVFGNTNGSYLRVNLATQRDFIGLHGALRDAVDLHETPPELVLWGQVLHESVKASVSSLDGGLTLPPIVFETK